MKRGRLFCYSTIKGETTMSLNSTHFSIKWWWPHHNGMRYQQNAIPWISNIRLIKKSQLCLKLALFQQLDHHQYAFHYKPSFCSKHWGICQWIYIYIFICSNIVFLSWTNDSSWGNDGSWPEKHWQNSDHYHSRNGKVLAWWNLTGSLIWKAHELLH